MHTNVIITNKKRRTHAQSNYTNTKLKAWFRRLLQHLARKRSGPILHPRIHTEVVIRKSSETVFVVSVPRDCGPNDLRSLRQY